MSGGRHLRPGAAGMISIRRGSCLDRVRETKPDIVICDPPYLIFFLGKTWDSGGLGIEFCRVWLAECYLALPPGGELWAFMAPRTSHMLAQAMEESGFAEIRQEAWVYGSGFPKSLNVAKALDKMAQTSAAQTSAAQKWAGWGTALKPAYEPVIIGRKPC